MLVEAFKNKNNLNWLYLLWITQKKGEFPGQSGISEIVTKISDNLTLISKITCTETGKVEKILFTYLERF